MNTWIIEHASIIVAVLCVAIVLNALIDWSCKHNWIYRGRFSQEPNHYEIWQCKNCGKAAIKKETKI